MPAPLDSFIGCQLVTLKKAGFSYQKIADELGLKAKTTAQSVFRRYNKNKSYLPKNPLVVLQSYRKKPKENWSKMFKDSKTTLERIRVKYNSFSTKESISRTTVRRILRKHGVFSRVAAKKTSIKKRLLLFVKNGHKKMI